MTRRPFNLPARLEKLELLHRHTGASFFMIWGKDDADLEVKLNDAKESHDLNVGDRYDTRIWTSHGAPPSPRWTRAHEMSYEELVILAGGEAHEKHHLHPSTACQWSDAELSDFYAESLPIWPGRLVPEKFSNAQA